MKRSCVLLLPLAVLLLGAGGFSLDPGMMIRKADGLRRSGRRTEALAVLERAQAALPNHLGVLVAKGRLLDRMGRTAEADAIFKTFPDRIDSAGKELTALAVGCQEQALRTYDKELLKRVMKELYDKAQKAEPQDAPARIEAGMLFLEKYQNSDAEAEFQDVLLRSQDPLALYGMARVVWSRGDFAKAHALCGEVLKAQPGKPGWEEAMLMLAGLDLWDQDQEAARKRTAEVLKVNPECEEALVLQAAICFVGGRSDEGQALMARAEAVRPGWSEACRIIAGVMESWHRSRESILWLEKGLKAFPGDPGLAGDLGEILLHSSREVEGRRLLDMAYAKDPFNSRVSNTLNLLDEVSTWPMVQTRHFRIRVHPSEAPLLQDLMARDLERDYEELTALYGYEPAEQPIDVELYPSQTQFSVRTLGQPNIAATGVCFGRFMAVDSPAVRAQMGPFHWGDVTRHELCHVITLQRTDFRVPRWMTEGLSTYSERYHRGAEFDTMLLNGWSQGKIMNILDINRAFTHPQFPWHVVLAYCQGGAMCRYIAETWGFEGILGMLKAYKEGKDTEGAVREALGVSPAEFDQGFRSDLDQRMARIQRSPDMDDETLKKLIDSAPKDPLQQNIVAAQLGRRGKFAEMETWARRVLDAEKAPPEVVGRAAALAGEALRRLNRSREADPLFRQAAGKAPDYFLGHLGTGILLKAKGDHPGAILAFREARRCYPTYVDGPENPYLLEADACFAADRPEEGIKVLKAFCDINCVDTKPRLDLASALRDQGRPEEALKLLDEWLMGEVYNLEHHRLRADLLTQLKRPAEAAVALGMGSTALPKDLDLALDAAQALLNVGDAVKAKAFWEKARKLKPTDPRVAALEEKLASGNRPPDGTPAP